MTNYDVEEKLRKLRPVDRDAARAAWLSYLAAEGPERTEASDLLDVLLFQQARKGFEKGIFLDTPIASVCDGSHRLGHIMYPPGTRYCAFGLREDEWIKHVLITGMTGAGKTNLALLILQQLNRHQKPWLVFDWKRNYRDVLQRPGFAQTRVFTVGRPVSPFRFNPLFPPPDVLPGEWLTKLVDVLKHAYFVGEGVEYLLRAAIDTEYRDAGLFDEEPRRAPAFVNVRNSVARMRLSGRMQLWKASALRVLESLCFRHGLGPVVNVTEPWDYQRLLASNVILELDALSDADKIFLTEVLILWLYELRKSETHRERFKHALLIEEGHHVLSHKKEQAEGAETVMETCLRQIREFGEAVIVIDQEPTKLSNSIKANTHTKITFNLGNGQDVLDMARCMGLDLEEQDYIALLETGHAILRMKGRVLDPVLVRFPKCGITKGIVTDQAVAQSAAHRC